MASGRHLLTAVTQCWNPISPVRGPAQLRAMWGGYLLYCGLYVDVVYVVDTTRLWDLHWTIPLWLTALCCPRLSSLSSAPRLWADWRRICVRAQSAQCCASARWPGPPLEMCPHCPRRSHFHFPRDPPAAGCWLQDPGHLLTDQTLAVTES